MSEAAQIIENIVPISDFSRGRASQVFSKVADGTPVVVVKNNTPISVAVSTQEYVRLTEVEEDYRLLIQALERLSAEEGKEPLSHAAVMDRLGITQDEIDDLDDVEID